MMPTSLSDFKAKIDMRIGELIAKPKVNAAPAFRIRKEAQAFLEWYNHNNGPDSQGKTDLITDQALLGKLSEINKYIDTAKPGVNSGSTAIDEATQRKLQADAALPLIVDAQAQFLSIEFRLRQSIELIKKAAATPAPARAAVIPVDQTIVDAAAAVIEQAKQAHRLLETAVNNAATANITIPAISNVAINGLVQPAPGSPITDYSQLETDANNAVTTIKAQLQAIAKYVEQEAQARAQALNAVIKAQRLGLIKSMETYFKAMYEAEIKARSPSQLFVSELDNVFTSIGCKPSFNGLTATVAQAEVDKKRALYDQAVQNDTVNKQLLEAEKAKVAAAKLAAAAPAPVALDPAVTAQKKIDAANATCETSTQKVIEANNDLNMAKALMGGLKMSETLGNVDKARNELVEKQLAIVNETSSTLPADITKHKMEYQQALSAYNTVIKRYHEEVEAYKKEFSTLMPTNPDWNKLIKPAPILALYEDSMSTVHRGMTLGLRVHEMLLKPEEVVDYIKKNEKSWGASINQGGGQVVSTSMAANRLREIGAEYQNVKTSSGEMKSVVGVYCYPGTNAQQLPAEIPIVLEHSKEQSMVKNHSDISQLTAQGRSNLAMDQAKMLLTNMKPEDELVLIKIKDPDMALRIHAAVLLLKSEMGLKVKVQNQCPSVRPDQLPGWREISWAKDRLNDGVHRFVSQTFNTEYKADLKEIMAQKSQLDMRSQSNEMTLDQRDENFLKGP